MTTTPAGLPDATKLAVDRTRLAHDRTLMAWVRTATSLISFGFTIYKTFQYLLENKEQVRERLIGPRELALIMIALGIAALIGGTIEHRRGMKALRSDYGIGIVPYSYATVVAAVIGTLGLFLLMLVILDQ